MRFHRAVVPTSVEAVTREKKPALRVVAQTTEPRRGAGDDAEKDGEKQTKTLLLVCRSRDDQQRWLDAIRSVIHGAQSPRHHQSRVDE